MRTPQTLATIVALFGLSLLNAHPGAQQVASDQLPAFRSGVELVTVEVGVVDKNGRPIRDLRPDDFKVSVAGQPRRVVTAEYIQADASPDTPEPAEVGTVSTNEGGGTGRLFLFVVDSNTLEAGDARHVADATKKFFAGLTFADRSGLVSLPIGRRVPFTWAHDRVREALLQSATAGGMPTTWEYGNLSEARDIATRGAFALREVASRECSGTRTAGAGGFGSEPVGVPGQGAPQPQSGSGATGGAGETPRPGSSGSQQPATGAVSSGSDWAMDSCLRNIQAQAEMAWSMARANSLSSLAALRETLASLQHVQGDKTLILISGGWPLEEHDENSMVSSIAAEAAAARATVFTVFVPRPMMSASRRSISFATRSDQMIYRWAVENLASMTGGRSYSGDADMQGAFERLSRELGGYYRIGVEKTALDAGATGRRMKVQVAREGLAVRAREIFDVPTYQDRDWAARLASALDSPVPATALGLRVTSYLAADGEDSSSLRVLIAGDVSRLEPGDATLQIIVRDLEGKRVSAGEQHLTGLTAGTASFATNIRVPPGSYLVRLALQDAAGRVGSVDHRVEARPVSLGPFSATGPLLVHLSAVGRDEPHLTLDSVRTDERLAMELDLAGAAEQFAATGVAFEIASTADGPALIEQPARLVSTAGDRSLLAQAVADLRLLPPGRYVARARVTSGDRTIGQVHRPFSVLERAAANASVVGSGTAAPVVGETVSAPIRGNAAAMAPRFAVRGVLARPVLDGYLARVAARPDASFPGMSELIGRARSGDIARLNVSEAQAVQTPIAAFVRGLTLLAQNKLDPAAAAFRSAMRASTDFYPAMVYLGACYAAAGNDKEAAAIWRTALIKEGGAPEVHLLLADALLRQGSSAMALQVVNAARSRWPEDNEIRRRFVLASIMAGNDTAGLQALDELVQQGADDEATLTLGLLTLYGSISKGRSIEGADQDRARLLRLAQAYRTRGGASLPLVETWVAAVKQGQLPVPK